MEPGISPLEVLLHQLPLLESLILADDIDIGVRVRLGNG